MARSENRPRILLIGGDGARSGVPRHLGQLCRALAGCADLTVVHDRNRGGYDDIADTVQRIEIAGLRSSPDPRTLWRGWCGLARLLRQRGWDLVWLHARLPALLVRLGLAAGLIRLAGGTRIVLTYHGLPFGAGHRPLASVLSRAVERWMLRRCPPMDLICLTGDMAVRLRCGVGAQALARHRLHVIANRSDLGALPAKPRPSALRHLVMTGRPGYQKNYPLAVRLMAHLPAHYVLTLCGAGTESRRFQRRLLRKVDAATRARIRFAGEVADVRPLLAQADCHLLTSRYEGQPIGAIEAFEAGLPVVLPRVGGARELVAAHPLALCLPLRDLAGDAARIAALVETYRLDRATWAQSIRRDWARAFGPARWDRRMQGFIRQVLKRRAPVPGCAHAAPALLPDRHRP